MAGDLSALLLPLVVIVAGAAVFRALFRRLGQPPVLGELALGLLLGASFLAWAAPGLHQTLLPAAALPGLQLLGALGLLLFMFEIGSELAPRRGEGGSTVLVAAGGLIVPFALGLTVAYVAPSWFFVAGVDLPHAALVAVILAVSALPVLGRILEDLGLLGTRVGRIALGAGAIDDLFAWVILALVVGSAGLGLTGSLVLNLGLVVFVLTAAVLADRFLPALLHGRKVPMPMAFAGLLGALFAAAWLTDAAGLHAVLGPLAVGLLAARHPALLAYAKPRLHDLTGVVLLPTFFVVTGMATDLTLLGGLGLDAVAAMAAVASLGKFGGVLLGARAAGLPVREGVMASVLLNARGAVGLVVALIGFERGLLSAAGFALLVVVIVATTMAAPVALQGFLRWEHRRAVPAPAGPVPLALVRPIPDALRLLRRAPPGPGLPGAPGPVATPRAKGAALPFVEPTRKGGRPATGVGAEDLRR